jgi:phosphatidylglycerophosphate synthase
VASIVLDCVDGEIARARFEQSAAGARLDVVGDYLVNLSVFVGLGIGLARQGIPGSGLWAAVALVGGVGAAMLATHVFFVRPALVRGGDLHWQGDTQSLRGAPLTQVIEKVASRDYTYLLLLLAVIGHLEWFLYAAAVGSWLFVGGLVLYRLAWRARQGIAPGGPPVGVDRVRAVSGPHRATPAPTGQDA